MVKPASLPTPCDRRRRHDQNISLRDGAESRVEAVEERQHILAFAALAPILEDDIGHAGTRERRAVVERRHAGDVDHPRDARRRTRTKLAPHQHLVLVRQDGAHGERPGCPVDGGRDVIERAPVRISFVCLQSDFVRILFQFLRRDAEAPHLRANV
jgi:hypothetical protein